MRTINKKVNEKTRRDSGRFAFAYDLSRSVNPRLNYQDFTLKKLQKLAADYEQFEYEIEAWDDVIKNFDQYSQDDCDDEYAARMDFINKYLAYAERFGARVGDPKNPVRIPPDFKEKKERWFRSTRSSQEAPRPYQVQDNGSIGWGWGGDRWDDGWSSSRGLYLQDNGTVGCEPGVPFRM